DSRLGAGRTMFTNEVSFFFSSRRRHTRFSRDWSSDVCSSDLVNQLACSMIVDEDDLTPSGELDPAKIQLGASSTSSGFTPTRTGGNSQTQFNPTNRSQQ